MMVFLAMVVSEMLVAQTDSLVKNRVYLEVLGPGGLYSINYERIIKTNGLAGLSTRIGISYDFFGNSFFYPLDIHFSFGKKRKLEVGGGVSVIWNLVYDKKEVREKYKGMGVASVPPFRILYYPLVGYSQNLKKNFFFAVRITPILSYNNAQQYVIIPWGGVSFGKSF